VQGELPQSATCAKVQPAGLPLCWSYLTATCASDLFAPVACQTPPCRQDSCQDRLQCYGVQLYDELDRYLEEQRFSGPNSTVYGEGAGGGSKGRVCAWFSCHAAVCCQPLGVASRSCQSWLFLALTPNFILLIVCQCSSFINHRRRHHRRLGAHLADSSCAMLQAMVQGWFGAMCRVGLVKWP
jgi:hypothetical protein